MMCIKGPIRPHDVHQSTYTTVYFSSHQRIYTTLDFSHHSPLANPARTHTGQVASQGLQRVQGLAFPSIPSNSPSLAGNRRDAGLAIPRQGSVGVRQLGPRQALRRQDACPLRSPWYSVCTPPPAPPPPLPLPPLVPPSILSRTHMCMHTHTHTHTGTWP